MDALSVAEREKLARLLAMLGSDFAGERDAAGLAAHRLLKKTGLTWQQVLTPRIAAPEPFRTYARPAPEPEADWRTLAADCLVFPHLITEWEHDFLEGLPRFPVLSERQNAVLQRIAAKLRTHGCDV